MDNHLNIAFISPPMTSSNISQVLNCANILASISDSIYIILSYESIINLDKSKYTAILNIIHSSKTNKIERAFGYLLTQIRIVKYLLSIYDGINVCFFYMGDGLIIPILLSKILNKKVILLLGGSHEDVVKYNKSILNQAILFVRIISLRYSDNIIVYSPILVEKWNLQKYRNKILIAHEHYIDFENFHVVTEYNKRDRIIGYVGYLDELKGVFNFVESFPSILEFDGSIKFLVGGSGPLEEEIRKFCYSNHLNEHSNIAGWIPHNELINTLNKLKLLVLPSNSEGVPNIILESMACGTPVLATPVGAIPDIIKDGETGFIMESNSVECIRRNIIRILKSGKLEEVSKNARAFVEQEFNYRETIKNFKKVLK